MSDNDNERNLEMALSRSTLVRLLDYQRGLVVALTEDNERLRAELAMANAVREILRNADGTEPEPCPCCKRGLHHGSASAMMEVCPTCDHPGFAHISIVAEPCACCARGRDKSATVPDMLAECPTCHHEWVAHDKPCRCCARGMDHGRYPAATWECLHCGHKVPAHVNTRTEKHA